MTRSARNQTTGWGMVIPALLFVALFTLYPTIETLLLSLHQVFLALPSFGQPFVGLENYSLLFTDHVAQQAFLVTIGFVLLSTMGELILGLGIALVIHEPFKGRAGVRAAVLIPWAIPTVVASQLWRFIFNDQYGLANLIVFGNHISQYIPWLAFPQSAFLIIVLADVWKTASFVGLILLAGLQVIPPNLYDAAKIDGASAWQRFQHITLPLLKPAFLIALLFRTIDAFRVFDLVFVMTQGGPGDATQVIQFYGYKTFFTEGRIGYGSAISVSVFLMIILLSLFYIRSMGSKLLAHEGS